MRRSLVVALMLTFAATAMAIDSGNESDRTQVDRQGGDTIGDAVPITLPYSGTGTTSGYNDDYDETCPYTGSYSPDVVYTATPTADGLWDLDTHGSNYTTKFYVYDVNFNLIACHDGWNLDEEEDGRAYIRRVPLVGGEQYFIVIDGYGGDYGDYVLDISEFEPYELECPSSAELEGEPPLVNDYEDDWNGGCNWNPANPTFQPITMSVFCGVTGWYIYQGYEYNDTDWFTVTMPDEGVLEITGDAEEYTGIAVVDVQDCSVYAPQWANIGFGTEWQFVVTGEPGSTVWLSVRSGGYGGGPYGNLGPMGYAPWWLETFPYTYNYVLHLNLDGVATENHSWTEVKALFR